MCHLILLLPVIALPLFWVFPLSLAAPLYGAASALAGVVYYYAWETGHRPVRIGRERLRGAEGIVLATEPSLRVRVDGDIWQARTHDRLSAGEAVDVAGCDGLVLDVSAHRESAPERDRNEPVAG